MSPKRVQLKRTKGWRKPEGAIVVARPTKWGNPWKVGDQLYFWPPSDDATDLIHGEDGDPWEVVTMDAQMVVDWYRHQHIGSWCHWLDMIEEELTGHDLACWCPLDQPCHADVLLELANP